jgi:hypothetical protein
MIIVYKFFTKGKVSNNFSKAVGVPQEFHPPFGSGDNVIVGPFSISQINLKHREAFNAGRIFQAIFNVRPFHYIT